MFCGCHLPGPLHAFARIPDQALAVDQVRGVSERDESVVLNEPIHPGEEQEHEERERDEDRPGLSRKGDALLMAGECYRILPAVSRANDQTPAASWSLLRPA